MVISNSNRVRYWSSVKIPPAFTKGRCILLHCYAWHSRGCRTSSPWSSDHNDHIHECKGTGYGMKYWPAHREGAEHSPGLRMAGVKPPCFEWEENRCNECHTIWSWGERMGFGLCYVLAKGFSVRENHLPLVTCQQ